MKFMEIVAARQFSRTMEEKENIAMEKIPTVFKSRLRKVDGPRAGKIR
jgi:hypothetical protein